MKKIFLSLLLLLPVLALAQPQTRPVRLNPVIAVMDLQILYRDYDNRIEVAIQGETNPTDITIECPNASIKRLAGSWIIRPNEDARKCNIAVYAMVKGQKIHAGTREFRVLPLPIPEGYLLYGGRSYLSDSKIPMSILTNEKCTLEADYGPGTFVHLSFRVTEFKVEINGIVIECEGNTFSEEVRNKINGLNIGSKILISDIKAKTADNQIFQLKPINFIVK